jgi:2'-5' RNA ligase
MRLFVAIALPGIAAAELDQVVAPLRANWPGLRWTGRDAWHLTLAFLGEVDEALIPELSTRLQRAAGRHPRLALALAGAGAFPVPARARVLWTGIRGEEQGLADLARTVSGAARKSGVGLTEGRRRYQPHLTLARCRLPVDVQPLVEGLDAFAGTPWVAAEIYLIHSRLSAQPRYETLGSWPLRPPRPPRRPRGPGQPRDAGPDGGGPLRELGGAVPPGTAQLPLLRRRPDGPGPAQVAE